MSDLLLTITRLAPLIRRSPNTVMIWIRDGRLKAANGEEYHSRKNNLLRFSDAKRVSDEVGRVQGQKDWQHRRTRGVPPRATKTRPGSPERKAVYEWRAQNGYYVFHPGDLVLSRGAHE